MWYLCQPTNPTGSQLWFSDGKPITEQRGGPRTSSRLIIDNQGFIDISDYLPFGGVTPRVTSFLDLNGQSIAYGGESTGINLILPGDGSFGFSLSGASGSMIGRLKPIPHVSSADAKFMRRMIADQYIPYPNVPGVPGKPNEVIKALGRQLFPFSPFSFELALAVYDWTTASFARMVFMRIFAYTSIPQNPLPLDSNSIAAMIWETKWNSYNPQNADYMNSFMMQPAFFLSQVQTQLATVQPRLQHFANVQNRMLAAAFASMPRTSLQHAPVLFSGQPDIYQLGLSRIPVEFLECPLNIGPPDVQLQMAFSEAIAGFLRPGEVITTKMVWSFADSIDVAKDYNNGLILIAHPPNDNSRVWESATYITPLSNDPKKNEYTFAPGTQFRVLSLSNGSIDHKPVQFLELMALSRRVLTAAQAAGDEAADYMGIDNNVNTDLGTDATDLMDGLDIPGFDTAGVIAANIGPVVTDAADIEASESPTGEIDTSDIHFGDLRVGGIGAVDHGPGYMYAEGLDTNEVPPLPRLALSDIPMRRVSYPPYNHYRTHLDGGRRCNCVDETNE